MQAAGQKWAAPAVKIRATFHPYDRLVPWRPVDLLQPAGTLVIVRPAATVGVARIAEVCAAIRSRHPEVSVALRAEPQRAEEFANAAALLDDAGVGAIVLSRHVRQPLFRIITDEHQLTRVARWWAVRLAGGPGRGAHAAAAILSAAHAYRSWEELRVAHDLPSSRQLRTRHAPPGRDLFRLGRGLHACCVLQRMSDRSVEAVAFSLGYSGASALSHQMQSLFGAGPAWIRCRLGLDWLISAWQFTRRARQRDAP